MQMVLAQLLVTLLLAFLLLALGWAWSYSALMGGAIVTLTTALFAHKVFVPYRAQQPGQVLGQFYGAEVQKIVLTACLFGIVVSTVTEVNIVALFGTYFVVQLVPSLYGHFFVD
jgi:F0F1-type ATP synthase assembly protein I